MQLTVLPARRPCYLETQAWSYDLSARKIESVHLSSPEAVGGLGEEGGGEETRFQCQFFFFFIHRLSLLVCAAASQTNA